MVSERIRRTKIHLESVKGVGGGEVAAVSCGTRAVVAAAEAAGAVGAGGMTRAKHHRAVS